MNTIRPSVLFARKDSLYKSLDCDVWDEDRNALLWPGGSPVVCHPPCRLWGELSHMSTADKREKWTGLFAVSAVRIWGGCLEHPKRSKLWKAAGLPAPKDGKDEFGGFTVAFPQWWFDHPAEKWTWIYICGIDRSELPEIPFKLGEAEFTVLDTRPKGGKPRRPQVPRYWRDATPPKLADWLLTVARLCWKHDPDLGQIERGHVCKHGIRWPHKCDPCADAAWEQHVKYNNNQHAPCKSGYCE